MKTAALKEDEVLTFEEEDSVRLLVFISSIDAERSIGPKVCDESLLRCVTLRMNPPEEAVRQTGRTVF